MVRGACGTCHFLRPLYATKRPNFVLGFPQSPLLAAASIAYIRTVLCLCDQIQDGPRQAAYARHDDRRWAGRIDKPKKKQEWFLNLHSHLRERRARSIISRGRLTKYVPAMASLDDYEGAAVGGGRRR